MFLPHPRVKVSIVGSLRDREVACSASDRQGSNIESCVWRAVSSQSSHPVGLAQFSLYVHKGGLKPDSFHFGDPSSEILQSCNHDFQGGGVKLLNVVLLLCSAIADVRLYHQSVKSPQNCPVALPRSSHYRGGSSFSVRGGGGRGLKLDKKKILL